MVWMGGIWCSFIEVGAEHVKLDLYWDDLCFIVKVLSVCGG